MTAPPIGACSCRACEDAIVARGALAAVAVVAYDRLRTVIGEDIPSDRSLGVMIRKDREGDASMVDMLGDCVSVFGLAFDYGRLYRAAELAHAPKVKA